MTDEPPYVSLDRSSERTEHWELRSETGELLELALNDAAGEGFRLVSTGVAAASGGADEIVVALVRPPGRRPVHVASYRVVTGSRSSSLVPGLERERRNGYDVLSVSVISMPESRQRYVAVCERARSADADLER